MAMTMAETVIRKACDRCHAQKLSCKRDKDESCERCLRLKTECKSSPSLRYKKGSQQQQQQQPQQHPSQHQRRLESPPRRRSPKRRRTDSDPSLVPPDAGTRPCLESVGSPTHLAEAVPIVSHTDGLTKSLVTPDPVLEIGDFNFNFDPLGLFSSSEPEYLSHPGVPGVERVHHPQPHPHPHHPHPQPQPPPAFTDSWEPRLAPSAYSVAPDTLIPGDALQPVLQGPGQGCVPEHGSSDKRAQRTRQRPRQIYLGDQVGETPTQPPPPLARDVRPLPWMAQLTDINTRLLDLSSALPPPQETMRARQFGRPTDERFKATGFPIDEIFKLTRRVADILEQPPGDASGAIDSSDPGNAMLMLSTYTRLLDMYQRVFALVHAELRQTATKTKFRFWKLPDVTVGSFAVQSSPFLQMSLTVQLAEEFLSRLRRWSGAPIESASTFARAVDVSFQAFREREEELARHLVELRSEIEALLDS